MIFLKFFWINRIFLNSKYSETKFSNIRKNIKHYALCLEQAITHYNRLLPNFTIRIYIDNSIIKNTDAQIIRTLDNLKKNNTLFSN